MNKTVLDFTQPGKSVEVAVMPAKLAKLALLALAKDTELVGQDALMHGQLIQLQDLRNAGKYEEFVQANLDYALERQLMDNIKNEKWDAYAVSS